MRRGKEALYIILVTLAVFAVAGCKPGRQAQEKSAAPVDPTVSRRLAIVSPAFLSPKMERQRETSHDWTVVFAKDGAGIAYVEPVGEKFRVVHNGDVGKPYLGISELSISSDGRRVAYVGAINDHLNKMVVDGKEGYAFGPDDNHWFTPDGKRHISTVARYGGKYVVVEGRVISGYRIEGGLVIGPDSRSIAFSVKVPNGGRQFIVSDLEFRNKTVFDSCGDFMLTSAGDALLAVGCSKGGSTGIKAIDFVTRRVISNIQYHGTITRMKFSPLRDSLVFTYMDKDNKRYVVYNGREEEIPAGDEFMTDPIVLSDPESVGIVIGDVYKMRFYRVFQKRNKNGKPYGFISDLVSSGDGRHYAFVATDMGDRQMHIVVDGHEGPKFDKIVTPVFSLDSRLLVYRAREAGKRFVVVSDENGRTIGRHKDYEMVFQPEFLSDGRLIAYGVLDGNELWWKVENLAGRR